MFNMITKNFKPQSILPKNDFPTGSPLSVQRGSGTSPWFRIKTCKFFNRYLIRCFSIMRRWKGVVLQHWCSAYIYPKHCSSCLESRIASEHACCTWWQLTKKASWETVSKQGKFITHQVSIKKRRRRPSNWENVNVNVRTLQIWCNLSSKCCSNSLTFHSGMRFWTHVTRSPFWASTELKAMGDCWMFIFHKRSNQKVSNGSRAVWKLAYHISSIKVWIRNLMELYPIISHPFSNHWSFRAVVDVVVYV